MTNYIIKSVYIVDSLVKLSPGGIDHYTPDNFDTFLTLLFNFDYFQYGDLSIYNHRISLEQHLDIRLSAYGYYNATVNICYLRETGNILIPQIVIITDHVNKITCSCMLHFERQHIDVDTLTLHDVKF